MLPTVETWLMLHSHRRVNTFYTFEWSWKQTMRVWNGIHFVLPASVQ